MLDIEVLGSAEGVNIELVVNGVHVEVEATGVNTDMSAFRYKGRGRGRIGVGSGIDDMIGGGSATGAVFSFETSSIEGSG